MNCAQLLEVAPELALGSLPGQERAAAVAHLETCASCRSEVDQLTAVADSLVSLAPAVEPPVGFEHRVMERLGASGAAPARVRTSRRGWHRRLVAAGGLLGAAALGGGGWALGATLSASPGAAPSPSGSPGADMVETAFTAPGSNAPLGRVWTYWGTPAWMFMSVNDQAAGTTVSCQVVGADGTVLASGSFHLDAGRGWWGVPVNFARGQATQARLVDSTGSVIATAPLSGGPPSR